MKCFIVLMLLCVSISAQTVTRTPVYRGAARLAPAVSSGITNTTAGLIGWWTFDDGSGTTATDSSGSGFNGTLEGAVLPAWTNGNIGTGALFFNGTNASVNLGQQVRQALSFTNALGFTVTAWIKATMNRGSSTAMNVLGSAQQSTDRMVMQIIPSGNQLVNAVYNGSYNSKTASGFRSTNEWVFCSMIWSNATTVFAWTNAVIVTVTGVNPSSTSTAGTRIGDTSAVANPFQGSIDDVRIYNRPLSFGEITNIFQWRP